MQRSLLESVLAITRELGASQDLKQTLDVIASAVVEVLGFAHTVGEFGVILMIGGNIPGRTRVMSTAIFDFVETMRWREANLLAGGMVAFAFVVILAMTLLEKRFTRAGA